MILREILSQMGAGGQTRPDPAQVRERLREKGVSDHLIADALFLLDVLGDIASGKKESPPTRILSSEELQGLNPEVVGKLFRLYYLGYIKKEDLESVMTDLLFVPPDQQDSRARQTVAEVLGLTAGQSDYLFDGNIDSPVIH
ncbi:MAG: hypothetical protein A3I06_01905 [Candidatus Lindowbacteria bacterium RIFCSPLOWO2_02_FULL_62_12]|nr:MAG: hypothetical protein A3I06_01905 [Candidatus Lindowbacteria bacterium RIFCSPLOWO2_02_FULL_62_12]